MENILKLGPKKKCPIMSRTVKETIWDEGGKTKIVQILISHDKNSIRSIQFFYAVDGKLHRSEMHGELSDWKFDIVTFDHPEEYLTSLSGQYGNDRLATIIFGTNKRKYGPFGMIDNPINYTQFAYNFSPKSSFGGFHGLVCSTCVCAIGVYIRPRPRPIGSLAEVGAYSGSDKELKAEV